MKSTHSEENVYSVSNIVSLNCVLRSFSSFHLCIDLRIYWFRKLVALSLFEFLHFFSSGSPELATGSELRSKRVMAAFSSYFSVWRLSVSGVLATNRSRQIFLLLTLSASRSQDAFRFRFSRDTQERYKILL